MKSSLAISLLLIAAIAITQIQCQTVLSMRAYHSGKCVDVEGAKTNNGAHLIQWDCSKAPNQQFEFIDINGYFMIKAVHSGKCLDVEGGKTDNEVHIIQFDCKASDNQLWEARDNSLVAKHSGKCMDVEHASMEDGAHLIQYDCTGSNNQRFEIV